MIIEAMLLLLKILMTIAGTLLGIAVYCLIFGFFLILPFALARRLRGFKQ